MIIPKYYPNILLLCSIMLKSDRRAQIYVAFVTSTKYYGIYKRTSGKIIIWLLLYEQSDWSISGQYSPVLHGYPGTGDYCTMHAGHQGNKQWQKELFSILACLGWPVKLAAELCMVLSTPRYTLLIVWLRNSAEEAGFSGELATTCTARHSLTSQLIFPGCG